MRLLSIEHANLEGHELAIKKDEFEALRVRLRDARDNNIFKSAYSFATYLTEPDLLQHLEELRDTKVTPNLKTVFVIGIGGANLGAKAIIEAFPKHRAGPHFVFLDTLYSGEADEITHHVGEIQTKDECLVIVISKSGKTLETLAGAELLISSLEKKFESIASRLIVITSASSPLHTWAVGGSISTVVIPEAIVDRYSIFSPIGVVPLLFGGFEIKDLYAGALEALNSNLESSIGPAFQASRALDVNTPDGMHGILDLFYFSEQMETLGKWARQLIAESLGKENTVTGLPLNKSLTPTVSIGTTDLHSMLQLYLAQPKERITWFTTMSQDAEKIIGIPQELKSLLPNVDNANPEHLLSVIYHNIAEVYKEKRMPYIRSEIDSISLYDLGHYMMTVMLVTLGLAQLWSVDPFTQPNVEEYKDRVRKELSNRG